MRFNSSESYTLYPTVEKLLSFRHLSKGWNYGEGDSISIDTIKTAYTILGFLWLQGIKETDVFPGLDGQVVVTAYVGEQYLEFTIEPNNAISFLLEKNDTETEAQQNISIHELPEIIARIFHPTWISSFVYLTQNTTTTQEKNALIAYPFNLPVKAEEFQLLTNPASQKQQQAGTSVNIWNYSMKEWQPNHRYSGVSG